MLRACLDLGSTNGARSIRDVPPPKKLPLAKEFITKMNLNAEERVQLAEAGGRGGGGGGGGDMLLPEQIR